MPRPGVMLEGNTLRPHSSQALLVEIVAHPTGLVPNKS